MRNATNYCSKKCLNFGGLDKLKQLGQAWPVVPDAVAVLTLASGSALAAIEVDCATENPAVLRSKIREYTHMGGADAAAFQFVFIAAPGWRRLRSLIRALYELGTDGGPDCFLFDLDGLWVTSVHSRAFVALQSLHDENQPMLVGLAEHFGCPDRLSSRQESPSLATAAQATTSEESSLRVYAESNTEPFNAEE